MNKNICYFGPFFYNPLSFQTFFRNIVEIALKNPDKSAVALHSTGKKFDQNDLDTKSWSNLSDLDPRTSFSNNNVSFSFHRAIRRVALKIENFHQTPHVYNLLMQKFFSAFSQETLTFKTYRLSSKIILIFSGIFLPLFFFLGELNWVVVYCADAFFPLENLGYWKKWDPNV